MIVRRTGWRLLPLLLAVGLIASTHAAGRQVQEGRIEFMGAVVPTTEAGGPVATGTTPPGAAETHEESLKAAMADTPPELLDYFVSYAGKNTRVVVTTYN